MDKEELIGHIRSLAREKNALILAHNYQSEDVQDIAHHTGDSLELARIAANNDASIIVFCGVHFMAESASMLAPDKKVILPDPEAGCPMADMADADDVLRMKNEHPAAAVVTYINSTAAVKAVSDVCCTSSNAVTIVARVDAGSIIFVPDRNLGNYVQRHTSKQIIPWRGFCPTHERFTVDELVRIKSAHPGALVIVHPECRPEVVDMADEVLSTGKMVAFAQTLKNRRIIVGTELGMLHKLKKASPSNDYILASPGFICPNMKKITLRKIYDSLISESPIITVDRGVAERAVRCLDRMLEMS